MHRDRFVGVCTKSSYRTGVPSSETNFLSAAVACRRTPSGTHAEGWFGTPRQLVALLICAVVCLVMTPPTLAQGLPTGAIPSDKGTYTCRGSGFGWSYWCPDHLDPKLRTPSFKTCAAWVAWIAANVPPPDGPFTAIESTYNLFNVDFQHCKMVNSLGGTAYTAERGPSCKTGYSVVPDTNYQYCAPNSSSMPNHAKNFGICTPGNTNPINIFTGNKYQREEDYRGAGPFPLEFVRYYNSGNFVENLGGYGSALR